MYLSDLIVKDNTVITSLGGKISGKVFFESNPEILEDSVNLPNNIVTKKYLDKLLSNLFGPNIFDENKLISPVNIYVFNITEAECFAGEYLIFELVTAPIPKANITLKLNILSGSAMSGVDYINSYEYKDSSGNYINSSDSNLIIPENQDITFIRIKTEVNDLIYGEKILILKIVEVVNYNSPENPYFIHNEIGIGKIKERLSPPVRYDILINNPECTKDKYLIFKIYFDNNLKITDPNKFLKFKFEVVGLTATSDVDYFTNYEFSYDYITWESINVDNYLTIYENFVYLRIKSANRPLYTGDKSLLFNIVEIIDKPDPNSIVSYLTTGVGVIREIYEENINSSLVISDAYCLEGDSLIFDTEILNYNFENIYPAAQIVIYYDIKNLTAYSGIDFNEVMFYSLDDGVTYIPSSSRQVIYNKNNVKIRIPTIYRDNYNNDRNLLLKATNIVSKPSNLILNISDIGIGLIKDKDPKPVYVNISIDDRNTIEGNNIVFDLNLDTRLLEDIILEIDLKDLTALDSQDYLKSTLQYSINEGSTYIDASFSQVIIPKDYLSIKLRLLTIRRSSYTNTRSFFIKVKKIIQKPKNVIFNYSDIAIGNILDDTNPPINYKIEFNNDTSILSVRQSGDLIINGSIYPPLQSERLEFDLLVFYTEDQENYKASIDQDFSLIFSSFKTDTVNIYNSLLSGFQISLIKNTTSFTIKIPTYLNLNKNFIKRFKLKINNITYLPDNVNVDITDKTEVECLILL